MHHLDDSEVSIHARTRRATLVELDAVKPESVSIHARTRRATWAWRDSAALSESFQSTPAHGGRPRGRCKPDSRRCFNPRPHTAGDLQRADVLAQNVVSIHARTRRATWRAAR